MMGNTMNADPQPGHGEQRLKDKNRRLLRMVAGMMGVGMATGGAVGLAMGLHFGPEAFRADDVPLHIQWLVMAGVALFVITVAVGSWLYFRAIDELEYEANKIAGLIGINVYAVLYMSWWPLAKVGVTPPPHGEAIFLITMASAIVAFCCARVRTSANLACSASRLVVSSRAASSLIPDSRACQLARP